MKQPKNSMRIGDIETLVMHDGGFKVEASYPLYIQTERESESDYFSNPHMFAIKDEKKVLVSELARAGVPFQMNQRLMYDGVPVFAFDMMPGSVLVSVKETMAWENAPEAGSTFWINFSDEYLKYTGE